ncbi:unnamed protein product [Medioppia subpectinata]|uniref:Kelch domain-containing protein 3 n=1 Tax=Medioppia subpectinata TaxID=1979941 RepID=A0A7R9KZ70_9ACAR|nr:unnamed protein product [Medioppia subpectinata]CAG2112598.1 unnamed protein product [Medioppia subpectinata]
MYWTTHLEGGPKRVNHAAVSVGRFVYSFGGYCTGDNYGLLKPIDCHILDTETLRWTLNVNDNSKFFDRLIRTDSDLPFQRYGHSVVANGDLVYLWGGRNDVYADHTLYCFDTNTGEWLERPKVTGSIPGARDGHTAVAINNKMYIFGGYEELTERFSNDIYCLDLTTYVWTYVNASGTPPSWRDFHSAVAYEDKMFVFGGRSDRSGPSHSQQEIYCNVIMYFNTTTNNWVKPETHGLRPNGRRSHSSFVYNDNIYVFGGIHSSFVYNDNIYVFGGYNGVERIHYNDLYKYDPKTLLWSLVEVHGRRRPCARRRQCCCVVGDKLYLFGGTSPFILQHHSIESLSPAALEYYSQIDLGLRDHSDLYILDFKPSLKTLSILVAIEKDLNKTVLPKNIQMEIDLMTRDNSITRISPNVG